jgi:hypothetical protein
MAELRPVVEADIDKVCVFLETNMRRGMTREQYRQLFLYPWLEPKPGLGYVLTENNEIVGFLGAIYSDRTILGRVERFCNLTNWCVLPEFRGESLKLLFAILGKRGQTIVNLSPSAEVEKMLVAMKYQVLDTYKRFSLPLVHTWTLFGRGRIIHQMDRIVAAVDAGERQIIRDHAGCNCTFLLVVDGKQKCLVVSKQRTKQGVRFSEILYASDATLLRAVFEKVKWSLLKAERTWMVAIDERLMGVPLPFTIRYRRISFFQSKSITGAQIDNLYSETAVL